MAINFGILQQPQNPTQTQMVSLPNYNQLATQNVMQGINSGVQNYTAMADQARQGALLPGQLQQQQATLAQSQAATAQTQAATGLLGQQTKNAQLENQKGMLDLQQKQFQTQAYHQQLDAYGKVKQAGGSSTQALDALQDEMMKTDPSGAVTLATNRAAMNKTIADGNIQQVTNEAAIVHGVMSAPDPLQAYKAQYKQIQRVSPTAPDPSTFKNSNDFINTYAVPALETAYPYQKQMADQMELNKSNEAWKAQNMYDNQQAATKAVLNNPNSTQEDRDDAAQKLQNAQDNLSGTIHGKGIMGQIGYDAVNSIAGAPKAIYNKAMGLGQQAVNALSGNTQPPQAQPATSSAPVAPPSQADIEFTAQKYNMTTDQVKAKLGIK